VRSFDGFRGAISPHRKHINLVLTAWIIKNLTIELISRVVKEEIIDDSAHLPCFNGRVVSWVSFFAIPVQT
jgi:hypothetical protein